MHYRKMFSLQTPTVPQLFDQLQMPSSYLSHANLFLIGDATGGGNGDHSSENHQLIITSIGMSD